MNIHKPTNGLLVVLAMSSFHASSVFAAEEVTSIALDEIIITAQKRSENLQDVPSSISAFSEDVIEDAGWADIDRLQDAMPSVIIGGEDGTKPYIYIRGIGTSKFDIGSDGSIGIFVDEVFSARASNNLNGIMDLERIEVLKGPQGTLYGRNTIGGAISMYTKKPGNEFEGKLKVGVGSSGQYLIAGSVSGALIENKLRARLSLAGSDQDGVFVDTISGNTNNNKNNSARLTLLATPSENLEITLVAEKNIIKSDAVLAEPLAGIVGYAHPALDFSGVVTDNTRDRYSNAYSFPGFSDIDSDQISLKVKWFGDSLDFTSITSRSSEDYSEARDFDGSAPDSFSAFVDQSSTQYSQEFRLNSTNGGVATLDDKLQWVLGVFYYNDDASRLDEFNFGPASILAAPPPFGVTHNNNDTLVNIDTTSYAVYGQATYALTQDLGLTVGLRHTDDKKKFTYQGSSNTPMFPVIFADFQVEDTLDFSSTDPRISLDYKISDDAMVYASYATGFKSGGVQYAVSSPATAANSFDEEKLSMIELGIKSRMLEGRMQFNAALYRYKYTDQQVQSIVDVGGAPEALTQNAGESTMTGVEFDVVALLTENFKANFNYTYQDAEFDKFASLTGSLAGNRMPRTPDHALSFGLDYSMDLGAAGMLNLQGNYAWKDSYFFNFENTTSTDSYGVLNLSAWWDLGDDRTRLRVYCNNCGNQEYLNQVLDFPITLGGGGRETWALQRRYGAEVSYKF